MRAPRNRPDDDGATTIHDHGVPRPRLPSLTSLRFFAAGLVVVVHLQVLWPAAVVLQRGEVGVSFFYLLSGFILTWAPSTTDSPIRFYRRRFARIVPVHVLTWVIAVGAFFTPGGSAESLVGKVLSLFLLQAWVPTSSIAYAANGVSWSLSVEVLFYASFPLAFLFLRRLRGRQLWVVIATMIALMILILLLAPRPGLVYIFPLSRLPEFIVGIALSRLVQGGWRPPIRFWHAAVLAAAGVVVDFLPIIPDRWAFAAITVVPFGLLIAAACVSDVAGRSRLTGRWWVRLGEWSFALFMTHELVFRLLVAAVPDRGLYGLLIVPVIVLCVAIAGLVFTFIEKPSERLLRGQQGPRGIAATNLS